MKKAALLLLLSACAIFAQTAIPPVLADMGYNPLCTNPPLGFAGMCDAPAPEPKVYALIVQASSPQTTVFRYSVTGTLPDGTVKTIKGTVDRMGPTAMVLISFGGAVSGVKIYVEEFALIAAQTSGS